METYLREIAPYLAAIIAAVAAWWLKSQESEFDERQYYQSLIRDLQKDLQNKVLNLERQNENLKLRFMQLQVENRQLRQKLKDKGIDPEITL